MPLFEEVRSTFAEKVPEKSSETMAKGFLNRKKEPQGAQAAAKGQAQLEGLKELRRQEAEQLERLLEELKELKERCSWN